jgi:hypothetical protein
MMATSEGKFEQKEVLGSRMLTSFSATALEMTSSYWQWD